MKNLKPSKETELTAMRVVMEHERTQGRQVEDVSAKNLGYDVTSLDTRTGDLKLIEVKGLAAGRERYCSAPTSTGWPRTAPNASGSTW